MKLPFGENNYPVFTLPPEIRTEVADNVLYLTNLCIEGLKNRYEIDYLPGAKQTEEDSLAKELRAFRLRTGGNWQDRF